MCNKNYQMYHSLTHCKDTVLKDFHTCSFQIMHCVYNNSIKITMGQWIMIK